MNNITDIIGGDLTSLLKNAVTNKFVNPNNSTFYPGKIINNKDPKKLGRCQIRVYGVYDDAIPDEDLPWAIPDFTFTGSTLGSFIVPTVDSIVNVYLDNGDLYTPKYTTKVLQKDSLSNMSSTYDKDYPNTMVFFETDNGDYFKINRKTLEAEFRHASGLIITIDKDGDLTVNTNVAENGNVNIMIKGNVNVYAKEDISLSTLEGNIYLQSANGDTALWQPNILHKCLYNGAPHGGATGGITSLKGGPS